jgi:hypothetical protein
MDPAARANPAAGSYEVMNPAFPHEPPADGEMLLRLAESE